MTKLAKPRTNIFNIIFNKSKLVESGSWYALRYLNPNYKEERIFIFDKNRVENFYIALTKIEAQEIYTVIGYPIPLKNFKEYFIEFNSKSYNITFDIKYFE